MAVDSRSDYSTVSPACPSCGVGMVRRTARRGPNRGNQFWGCPKYPKCRGVIFSPPPAGPKTEAEVRPTFVGEPPRDARTPSGKGESSGKVRSAVLKVAKAVDKVERWSLERDEPDAAGRWDPDHGRKVLRYVFTRDGGRCGVCAAKMKLKGAHIEHIVPKVFAWFDLLRGGKVATGTQYRSLLHKLDNLQAAHTYCNKRKGNTPEVRKWRHPIMPPLTVAVGDDGEEFVVPSKAAKRL